MIISQPTMSLLVQILTYSCKITTLLLNLTSMLYFLSFFLSSFISFISCVVTFSFLLQKITVLWWTFLNSTWPLNPTSLSLPTIIMIIILMSLYFHTWVSLMAPVFILVIMFVLAFKAVVSCIIIIINNWLLLIIIIDYKDINNITLGSNVFLLFGNTLGSVCYLFF